MLSPLHLLISPSTFYSLSKTTLALTTTTTKSSYYRIFHNLLLSSKSNSNSNSTSNSTMSINLQFHAFAGNPIRSKTPKETDPLSSFSSLETLKTILSSSTHISHDRSWTSFKVLPFRKGRPLASTSSVESNLLNSAPVWHLGWMSLLDCKGILDNSKVSMSEEDLVYLGSKPEDDEVYWAIDVSSDDGLVNEFGNRQFCFVELRTLMVATDWGNTRAMGDLAIAGHARALIEWHTVSRYCGGCGKETVSMEAGRRKQCSNELCKKRIYPRTDPVVIMLVIDKVNDRVLLSRQSKFVPRMWSCLAGFIEPGESLEEAVRRETWEETGIEVGEVTYHSSQPWPVGPSNMPCQLMVGFFAYAISLDINVDKEELEDAQWYSRQEVKEALTFAEYKKAQMTSADKVDQMCKGVEKSHNLAADYNVESGELTPMFVPGPFAIAHHLISSWVSEGSLNGGEAQSRIGSLSNL